VILLLAALGASASALLTGIVYAFALRRGVVDEPNARSSHSLPTARGGGLGLLVAGAIGVAVAVWLGLTTGGDAVTLGVGVAVMGAVGWADDVRGVAPAPRLGVHVAVALWTVARFGGLPALRLGEISLALGGAGWLLGVLGIVWSINLFNFMDGIDGLAGSHAMLVFGAGAVLLLARGEVSLGTIAAIVAGAAAGFLLWNSPPARIFMGDVGSGTLGYLLAALAIGSENRHAVPLATFIILNGVFVADATVTLARRMLRRERLTEAHRDHAYQRLARAWESHRAVTWRASVVTLVLALLATIATLATWLFLPTLGVASLLLIALLFAAERRAPL